jgi:hypothetical protein
LPPAGYVAGWTNTGDPENLAGCVSALSIVVVKGRHSDSSLTRNDALFRRPCGHLRPEVCWVEERYLDQAGRMCHVARIKNRLKIMLEETALA